MITIDLTNIIIIFNNERYDANGVERNRFYCEN
jgi:hypothetical protein